MINQRFKDKSLDPDPHRSGSEDTETCLIGPGACRGVPCTRLGDPGNYSSRSLFCSAVQSVLGVLKPLLEFSALATGAKG